MIRILAESGCVGVCLWVCVHALRVVVHLDTLIECSAVSLWVPVTLTWAQSSISKFWTRWSPLIQTCVADISITPNTHAHTKSRVKDCLTHTHTQQEQSDPKTHTCIQAQTPTQHPFITWLGRCGIQLMRHHSGCYPECIALALQGFTLFGHSLTCVELSAFVQKVQKVTHCCLCMVCVRFLYNEW